MPVIPFATLDEAIGIANSTPYGLGASIWTKNITTACTAAEQIRSGVGEPASCRRKSRLAVPEIRDTDGRTDASSSMSKYTEPKSILIGL